MSENVFSPALTAKQELFIAAVLAGNTLQVSARIVHISEKTAQRWFKLPAVRAALQHAREEIRQQAMDLLQSQTLQSVETIVALRDDEEVQAQHRLKAAQIVLELATKDAPMLTPAESQEQNTPHDSLKRILFEATKEELDLIGPTISTIQKRLQTGEQEKISPIHRSEERRVG